ncbi:extracellular matrix-binding ebh [Babesia caballi]|uniref:Extracellular matrix-binding ebh n=1 Tax=Babesia caballi TaxID=5871 RepID=A0AAV4LVZ1_BABCB|nr:extracellular matrix-binding ebh [Babesia caballi]
MNGQGFNSKQLSGKLGSQIVSEAMKDDNFKDFKTALEGAKTAARTRADKEDEARTKLGIGKSHTPGTAPTKVPANQDPTYPEYLQALCGEWSTELSTFTPSNGNSLSALYYVSYLYFRGKQYALSNAPEFKPRPPSTIREMLYFLAALPFSHSYDEFDKYITQHFKIIVGHPDSPIMSDHELMIPVADSSSPNTNNTLSAADLKDHLTNTCHYSTTILSVIQGNSGSENPGEPWLHELYSNGMKFKYPSDPILFSTLSNYAYALQFQLYFLYTQCAGTYSAGCGWNQCQYGAKINISGDPAPSHICAGFKCTDPIDQCQHKSNKNNNSQCYHNDASNRSCGTNGSISPLQAFLTDNLNGFSLPQQAIYNSVSHLDNHSPGSMCHMKMGFSGKLRLSSRKGNLLSITLQAYCGAFTSPLRQLCEKLGCLTKRTPRSLGDVFGFIWHLNGQLFKNERPTMTKLINKFGTAFGINGSLSTKFSTNPYSAIIELWNKMAELSSQTSRHTTTTVLSKSLEYMAPSIPFLYQFFMMEESQFLPGALFDLTQHCHKWEGTEYKHQNPSGAQCSNPNDLWSIYQPVSAARRGGNDPQEACRANNCGGYVEPLTLTYGATFSPSAAPAYLSWMSYLTDDLHDWLSEMLDEFRNISCDDCNPRCTNGKSCHATSAQCTCPSVVQCAGVLPLIYRYGFQFHDAYSLKYTSTTRNCKTFSQQLSNVLSPDAPLVKLLETIDSFLYLFRIYFFYNLSSFWLCSLAILLYFIFYGIDMLHVKSHVHLPSSHTVPPIGLLTTGKAPALTKLAYYMP